MIKYLIVPFVVAALWSCSTTKKAWEPKHEDGMIEAIDTVDAYTDENGRVVWLTTPPGATYDPYEDKWEGRDADRINKVWRGRIALDTIAPIGERKWKWIISEEEKHKMTKEDIRLGDSIINFINGE